MGMFIITVCMQNAFSSRVETFQQQSLPLRHLLYCDAFKIKANKATFFKDDCCQEATFTVFY